MARVPIHHNRVAVMTADYTYTRGHVTIEGRKPSKDDGWYLIRVMTGVRKVWHYDSHTEMLRDFSRLIAQSEKSYIPRRSTAPIGPLGLVAQACVPANEKLVVRTKDVKKSATATSSAPQKLKPASKPPEMSAPANPPGGIAPRTSGKWQSASRTR